MLTFDWISQKNINSFVVERGIYKFHWTEKLSPVRDKSDRFVQNISQNALVRFRKIADKLCCENSMNLNCGRMWHMASRFVWALI